MTKKRIIALITSYVLSAFVIMGGFIYTNHLEAVSYRRQINAHYQHAFSELVTSMEEIDAALQKSLYATSPSMVSSLCTDIFGKAMAAQMSMGELPFSGAELRVTASFISKVGDYAYSLSKSASDGSGYSEEELENLVSLSDAASILAGNLTQLQADMNSGALTITELSDAEKKLARASADTLESSMDDTFKVIEQEFPEIPSLIYDGPFSEHIQQMSPRLIENLAEISADKAKMVVASFLDIDENKLTLSGESGGSIPSYYFSANLNGSEVSIEVTKLGGKILNMSAYRTVNSATMTAEDAVNEAKKFLENQELTSMKESYWTIDGNTCLINFAYEQDGITCYSDLVKVRVALDDGEIIGFEAMGYIMSHYQRQIPEVTVDIDSARSKVAPSLKVLSQSFAIIPTDGKNEKLCYEFKCENEDENHYIIYVDAQTGNEEKILILLESENGTLTL